MAAEILSVRNRKSPGFMTLLSSAACEWFLIFLLFMDVALSYLLTKFAQYCELKIPCLLCSRLDPKKKPGYYWTLLCRDHREEMSWLVPCSIHNNLADVNEMCEECFMPIVRQQKLNSESYRLLVGKLWVDVERSVLQSLMLNKNIRFGSLGRRTCSCCNKTWRAKTNAERLLGLTPVVLGASKANLKPPLPRVPGRSRFSRRDSLKRLREKFSGPIVHHSAVGNTVDKLSHVGYTKLKISSDSESEVQFSEDDEDGNAVCHCKNESMMDYNVQSCVKGPPKTQDEKVKPSTVDLPNLLDLSDAKNFSSLTVDTFIEHGLRELNWAETYHKPNQFLTPDLVSLDDGSRPLDVGKGSFDVSTETSHTESVPKTSLVDEGPGTVGDTLVVKNVEAAAGTSSVDAHSSLLSNINITNASTQILKDRESSTLQPIGQIKYSDSAENEDDMMCPPQESTSDAVSSSKDKSPRAHSELIEFEDFSCQANETSQRESLEGIDDVEGENIVDRLQKQVEQDKIYMNSLYKELEEERNAAAIAANEAMAMITRLQEEKASLHMEALQYLRMMEEQAEYDVEALERANDVIAEKEKELQDLEAELEFYRNNYSDESFVIDKENSPSASSDLKSQNIEKANGIRKPAIESSALKFVDEKLYILQCLKKLEKKIHQAQSELKMKHEVQHLQDPLRSRETSLSQENEDNGSLGKNHTYASNETLNSDKENDIATGKREKSLQNGDEIKVSALEKEIVELHERLETLETDQDFLEHVSNLLQSGNDGLNLIQEIAHQLQQLRNVEFNKR